MYLVICASLFLVIYRLKFKYFFFNFFLNLLKKSTSIDKVASKHRARAWVFVFCSRCSAIDITNFNDKARSANYVQKNLKNERYLFEKRSWFYPASKPLFLIVRNQDWAFVLKFALVGSNLRKCHFTKLWKNVAIFSLQLGQLICSVLCKRQLSRAGKFTQFASQ
jgi:hypothetical protein